MSEHHAPHRAMGNGSSALDCCDARASDTLRSRSSMEFVDEERLLETEGGMCGDFAGITSSINSQDIANRGKHVAFSHHIKRGENGGAWQPDAEVDANRSDDSSYGPGVTVSCAAWDLAQEARAPLPCMNHDAADADASRPSEPLTQPCARP